LDFSARLVACTAGQTRLSRGASIHAAVDAALDALGNAIEIVRGRLRLRPNEAANPCGRRATSVHWGDRGPAAHLATRSCSRT
jgi:hypothetical protein